LHPNDRGARLEVAAVLAFRGDAQTLTNSADYRGFRHPYWIFDDEGYVDFVDIVVPEWQSRGAYKRSYREETLRQKLGGHALLKATHPSSRYRNGSRAMTL